MTVQLWTNYLKARDALTTTLRQNAALTRLSDDDQTNWIASLCDAWGALADVIGFYQRRIVEEAFLSTAEQAASVQLIYHSLGHAFPPNATATTTLAYHLSANVAGVEAVARGGSAGGTGVSPQAVAQAAAGGSAGAGQASAATVAAGTPAAGAAGALPGMQSVGTPAGVTPGADPGTDSALSLGTASTVPAAAQVRAIPSASGAAPVFVTLAGLGAYVGASRLAISSTATAPPPQLTDATTLLELAGTKTGLAVGQPILIAAQPAGGGAPARWSRFVTDVHADANRGSTRIGWEEPLGSLPGELEAAGATNPVVFGFATSTALAGAGAPDWAGQPLARQLAATTDAGAAIPVRGGLASSGDEGTSWTLSGAGLPAGVELTAVGAYGDIVIVSAGASGVLRAAAGAPFAPATFGAVRRPVGFLGGTLPRMLAGAAGGVVYESVDQGQSWSPVAGGPPSVGPVMSDGNRSVISNQLPSTTVRCVIPDPAPATSGPDALLAGTDAGVFRYTGGNWQQAAGLPSQTAVFALLTGADGTLFAATPSGVCAFRLLESGVDGLAWTEVATTGLTDPAYALAEAAGDVYAAASTGVWVYLYDNTSEVGNMWRQASDGLPGGVTVNALLGDDGKLLAATDEGIYSAAGTAPALTWSRCDHAPAFTVPAAALPAAAVPATGAVPGPGLVAAFADYGIALDGAAALTPSSGGYVLTDGGHSYGLAVTQATGTPSQVTLLDAMPVASDLAQAPGGPVLAVGSPAASVANQWPGFAVSGNSVEIAPAVRAVAPGVPAIIEQRSATPSTTVLDVATVDQDSAVRAGRPTQLTRLHFSQTLTPGQYPRGASTVWTGAQVLPQFNPPNPQVSTLSGSQIELSAPLTAPVAAGQLVAVTGSPPGLTVAPLGGAMRVASGSRTPTPVGPPQADLTSVAIGGDGTVYLAGAEGVFAVAPVGGLTGTGVPQLLADGWPGGGSAGVVVAGTHVLAGSGSGVQQLSAASGTWSPAGASGAVVGLAGDGTSVVAAFADGRVLEAERAATTPVAWSELPKLSAAATTLAIKGSAVYAANGSGVFTLSDGTWLALGEGAIPGPDTCLQIDSEGTLWAGSIAGQQSYDPETGTWRSEPQVSGHVEALCIRPNGVMLSAGVHAVGEQQGTQWNAIADAPGATLGGMAAAADGSIWLATRASVALAPTSGLGSLEYTHATVLTGASASPRDLSTLTQGAIPDDLLAALADAGVALDPAHTVTTPKQTGCWLIRSGADLYIVVARAGGAASTLDVYQSQAVFYPTGPPASGSTVAAGASVLATGLAADAGTTDTWTVLAAGTPAQLTVQRSAVVLLPADANAPSFGETASLASTQAQAQAAPTTLSATSTLALAEPLANVYDAATVQVNLNVVTAAAGQVVSVPIGSGDPQQVHQSFKVPTPVAAIGATAAQPTASPSTSLNVYVNGSPWTAVASLTTAGPSDTVYVQRQNTDGSATVSFGDGVNGARLPSGQNNVVATYLQGGGPATEVAPGALLQALDRPQLVTAVHNPLPALLPSLPPADQARLAAVRRLDRTVTIQDYEDLVLSRPGVASARIDVVAGPLGRALVISVALAPDAPAGALAAVTAALDGTSPSGLPVRVTAASIVPVLLTVQITSRQTALRVEPAMRSALSGLPARKPGDPLNASQVLSAAAAVPGVIAAQILSWERVYSNPGTSSSLTAAVAQWPAGSGAPVGAELLTIDGQQGALTINVVRPST